MLNGTDFKNNSLKAALGSVSNCAVTTLTGETFVFYMVNIKVSLRKFQDFYRSSIHRLERLEFKHPLYEGLVVFSGTHNLLQGSLCGQCHDTALQTFVDLE